MRKIIFTLLICIVGFSAYAQSAETVVPGASLLDKLQWLKTNAESNKQYRVEVTTNESINGIGINEESSPNYLAFLDKSNITVRFTGDGNERIISLANNGSLFVISDGVTMILDNNITLQGNSENDSSLVNAGGTLIMNTGAKISGNKGRGVYVSGTFTMTGGEITGNKNSGVFVGMGTFMMTGGKISGNTAKNGGGVYLMGGGTFRMSGGEISGNTATEDGGGVYLSALYRTTITVTGGTIYGYTHGDNNSNQAKQGHAVYIFTTPAGLWDNNVNSTTKFPTFSFR